jgi:hypothetical protein
MRKKIFFLASSLDARYWLSESSDPFPCSKQYYMLCVAPLSFHIKILLYQHGRSALDTCRTLFLLASTQGVSCRLVMNHLIYMYMFSLITPPPPHIYVSKCMYVYVHISLFLPECACTTIIDISPRIFKLIYCCCVSIIIVIVLLLCINHNCYLYMPSWGPDLVNKLILFYSMLCHVNLE